MIAMAWLRAMREIGANKTDPHGIGALLFFISDYQEEKIIQHRGRCDGARQRAHGPATQQCPVSSGQID
jgi:hypothetical protein